MQGHGLVSWGPGVQPCYVTTLSQMIVTWKQIVALPQSLSCCLGFFTGNQGFMYCSRESRWPGLPGRVSFSMLATINLQSTHELQLLTTFLFNVQRPAGVLNAGQYAQLPQCGELDSDMLASRPPAHASVCR
ncbi:hypothetical protein P7K49_021185 [Saguinus oedipus]|uniref:Uncharacterized protein n=1 Tax=Saguinus oedipus TaxID=9490 RepID=A0ABQ9URZ8_SAGOE|nr:hypothetical protein P7K49_021185 [Saguinus oedipus]